MLKTGATWNPLMLGFCSAKISLTMLGCRPQWKDQNPRTRTPGPEPQQQNPSSRNRLPHVADSNHGRLEPSGIVLRVVLQRVVRQSGRSERPHDTSTVWNRQQATRVDQHENWRPDKAGDLRSSKFGAENADEQDSAKVVTAAAAVTAAVTAAAVTSGQFDRHRTIEHDADPDVRNAGWGPSNRLPAGDLPSPARIQSGAIGGRPPASGLF